MPKVIYQDWGLIDYQEAWDRQESLFSETIRIKTERRSLESSVENPDSTHDSKLEIHNAQRTTHNSTGNRQLATNNYLIFCEHPHVYTLGKSGKPEHLLLDEQGLKDKHATYYKINRGGDITYHGPGQIVGYPILDLDHFFTDIHKYLRFLEEAIILTLQEYGIESGRVDGLTGVWIDGENPATARKICAMGVRCSRWVTMHGFAFNVNSELDYFKNIIPCGIDDKDVTSMERELGRRLDMEEVKEKLKSHIAALFEMTFSA